MNHQHLAPHCGLNFIFLTANDIEHIFMCCCPFFGEMCIWILCPF
jgi:hypothetical protein